MKIVERSAKQALVEKARAKRSAHRSLDKRQALRPAHAIKLRAQLGSGTKLFILGAQAEIQEFKAH